MTLSFGCKGHAAEGLWVVCEDSPQGIGKSRFILKEDLFVQLFACWVKVTSPELFLTVSHGGSVKLFDGSSVLG